MICLNKRDLISKNKGSIQALDITIFEVNRKGPAGNSNNRREWLSQIKKARQRKEGTIRFRIKLLIHQII